MRNMSFSITTEQIKNKTKTVTRRMGWNNLKVGDLICACKKCMGLKKGEKIEKLTTIRIINIHRERLYFINNEDCKQEGFPHLSPLQFIDMFCKEMKCKPYDFVNRIEFKYAEVR